MRDRVTRWAVLLAGGFRLEYNGTTRRCWTAYDPGGVVLYQGDDPAAAMFELRRAGLLCS